MKTVLFVCSGNTCRSPMAACLFNGLCEKNGREDVRAASAGTEAMSNMCASDGARRAMEKRGLTLKGHLSKRVSEGMMREADRVVCMGPRQRELLEAYYPWAKGKIECFETPVPDPYGGNDAVYEHTAMEMEKQIGEIYRSI